MSVCERFVNNQDPIIRLQLSAESHFSRAIYFPNNIGQHLLFMSQDYFGKARELKRKLAKAFVAPTFHLPCCKACFCVLSRTLPSLHEHQVLKPPAYQPANDLRLASSVRGEEDPEANLQAASYCERCSAQQHFYHPMLAGKNCAFLCFLF